MDEEDGEFIRYTYADLEIIKIGSTLDSFGNTYKLKNSVSIEFINVLVLQNVIQYEVYCFDYNGGLYYLYLDQHLNEISEPMGV